MWFACRTTNARTYKHTNIFNTIALFTVTMDTRTRLNATLYVHCLSSSLTSDARICKFISAQEMSVFLLVWRVWKLIIHPYLLPKLRMHRLIYTCTPPARLCAIPLGFLPAKQRALLLCLLMKISFTNWLKAEKQSVLKVICCGRLVLTHF